MPAYYLTITWVSNNVTYWTPVNAWAPIWYYPHRFAQRDWPYSSSGPSCLAWFHTTAHSESLFLWPLHTTPDINYTIGFPNNNRTRFIDSYHIHLIDSYHILAHKNSCAHAPIPHSYFLYHSLVRNTLFYHIMHSCKLFWVYWAG